MCVTPVITAGTALVRDLHFCCLSHVIVIPSVAAYWYVSGRRAAFGELLLMLSTVP